MWTEHLKKVDRSATDYVSLHHLGLILEQLAQMGKIVIIKLHFSRTSTQE